jgi:hypothetical protein
MFWCQDAQLTSLPEDKPRMNECVDGWMMDRWMDDGWMESLVGISSLTDQSQSDIYTVGVLETHQVPCWGSTGGKPKTEGREETRLLEPGAR